MAYADPEARRAYARRHYEENKDAYKRRAMAHRKKQRIILRDLVREIKEGQLCADCDREFPAVCMDFDHGQSEKERAIADMVTQGVTVERLLAEIAKCEIVCACCHRIRTSELESRRGVEELVTSPAS